WNYLLAWRDFVPQRPPLPQRPQGRFYLEEAGILIDRQENTELYLALNKGGAFKLFRNGQLLVSDTHFSLQVRQGKKLKNAVGHLVGRYHTKINDQDITIQGSLGWAKQKQMTPFNLIILRVVMLTVGRFFPNLIRKLLQKVLITGKTQAPFQFTRTFRYQQGQWQIEDKLQADSWQNVRTAGIGGDQTSIYVVMSRTFQTGQLQKWLDLTPQLAQLAPNEPLQLERRY
ncbi:MAG: hypothetical protein F6K03_17990, partial [Kamptonema sp. SIO4C4]|nr:hypothetical protein [Kamptonema sp. SIO4C4]